MRKISPLLIIGLWCVAFCPLQTSALNTSVPVKPESKPKFVFKDGSGKMSSVEVMDKYQPKKIVHPFPGIDSKIDPKLRAPHDREERARAHSHSQCWRFVKEALVAAGVVSSRPTTLLAKQARTGTRSNYGFKKLAIVRPIRCTGEGGAGL
jgi:hypothetical protein